MQKLPQIIKFLFLIGCWIPTFSLFATEKGNLEFEGCVSSDTVELERLTFNHVVFDSPVFHTLGLKNDGLREHKGVIRTTPFVLKKTIAAYVGGSFGYPGISLSVVDEENGNVLPLQYLKKTRGLEIKQWSLPSSWTGKTVRLVANDENPKRERWIGLGAVYEKAPWYHRLKNTKTLFFSLLNLILPLIVFSSIGMVAYRFLSSSFGIGKKYFVLITFSAPILLGYVCFYLSLVSSFASILVSILFGSFSVIICARLILQKDRILLEAISEYKRGILFCLLAVLLNLSVLHLVWSQFSSIRFAQDRFLTERLANDNVLPFSTMEMAYSEEGLKPFVMMWRSTDRPPLQASSCLLVRPFFLDAKEGYQSFSTFLQCAVLLGISAFLKALGIGRRYESLILSVMLFSGTFLINTTFVWPKFFPTLFLFILAGMLFGERTFRKDLGFWLGVGVSSCWVMLTHPGSIFAIGALLIVYTAVHRKVVWNQIIAAITVFVFLMLPWMLYQKLYDPPGNMLQKRFLADHPEFDDVPFGEALKTSYSALSWETWLDGRWRNVKTIFVGFDTAFGKTALLELGNGSLLTRDFSFVFIAVSLIPIIFAYPLSVLTWKALRREHRKHVLHLLSACLIGVSVWVVVILPAARTIISHGSYFFPALLMVLAPCLLIPNLKLLFTFWGVNTLYFFFIWIVPRMRPIIQEEGLLDVEIVNPLSALVVVASLCVLCWYVIQDIRTFEESKSNG